MKGHSSPTGEVKALLARGSAYTVATAFQLSSYVLVVPVVTRLLSQGAYGRLTAALVVVQVLTYLAALGIPYAVTLEYFDGKGGIGAARSLVVVTLAGALGVALAADLLGPWWADHLFSGVAYDVALRAAVWSTVPMALVLAVQSCLRADNRPGRFVVVTLVATVGAQLTGLAVALLAGPTAGAYMVGMAAGLGVAGGVGLCLCGVDVSRVRDKALLRSAFRLGIPTVPHALAMYVVAVGDRVLVERALGLGPVARYQVAYLVGALGLTLAGAVNNAWGPLVYGSDGDSRWRVLADTTATLYRLAALVVAGIALGSPLALAVVAPRSYDLSGLVPVTSVVALSLLPFVGYLSNSHPVFHARRPWLLTAATPASAALNVVLNLVLLPSIGIMGAAYATVAAYSAQALFARWACRRLVTVPWHPGVATRAWCLAVAGVGLAVVVPVSGVWLVVRSLAALGILFEFVREVRRRVTSRHPAPDLVRR